MAKQCLESVIAASDLTLEVEGARAEAAGELARVEGTLESEMTARQKAEGAAKDTQTDRGAHLVPCCFKRQRADAQAHGESDT